MQREAEKYDFYVDFPSWYSCLSINEKAVTYAEQKVKEAEINIKLNENDRGYDIEEKDEIKCLMNEMIWSIEMSVNSQKKISRQKDY